MGTKPTEYEAMAPKQSLTLGPRLDSEKVFDNSQHLGEGCKQYLSISC